MRWYNTSFVGRRRDRPSGSTPAETQITFISLIDQCISLLVNVPANTPPTTLRPDPTIRYAVTIKADKTNPNYIEVGNVIFQPVLYPLDPGEVITIYYTSLDQIYYANPNSTNGTIYVIAGGGITGG